MEARQPYRHRITLFLKKFLLGWLLIIGMVIYTFLLGIRQLFRYLWPPTDLLRHLLYGETKRSETSE